MEKEEILNRGLVNLLKDKLDYNKKENPMNIILDTIILTNRYRKNMGDVKKIDKWFKTDLVHYTKLYKLDKEQVYKNINIVRDIQHQKKIHLPFYNSDIQQERDFYKTIKKNIKAVLYN